MNLAIIGSRMFTDCNIFRTVLTAFLTNHGIQPTCIISGGAVGADTLATEWAEQMGVETCIFRPQYDQFTRNEHWKANKLRNTQIANCCDCLIAFWDMNSTGTRDTIEKTIDLQKPVYIYNVNTGEMSMVVNREDLPDCQ